MTRRALLLAVLAWPALAGAQAIRCTDPATGRTLYTDQPCQGGALVVPPRSPEQQRQDADNAAQARERSLQQREAALRRERERLDAERAAQAVQAQRPLAESDACRAARAEASFRAGSFAANEEQIRTARYNAALACGQQPPSDVVVVQPQPWGAAYPVPPRHPMVSPRPVSPVAPYIPPRTPPPQAHAGPQPGFRIGPAPEPPRATVRSPYDGVRY
ncbi:MAG: hypothetical protein LCH89_18285 [Proteobacteria bacterium]|jgi:hypothetical protein|nr:hypothetical protein [Pseudomonadota bacterium]